MHNNDAIVPAEYAALSPEHRWCIPCSTAKPLTDFYPSAVRNGTKRCKDCANAQQRARWQACKTLVDSLKDAGPCPDCKIKWPPLCMEFDHRDPSEKDINLSSIVASGSMPRLLAELAKGEFVCACCHRIRTEGFKYRTGYVGRATSGEFLRHYKSAAEGDR